ncbi:RAB21 family protein [Megaselia abdita]
MASSASKDYNFKVVLLGEGCVGKTSIILRYVEDKFNSKHISTLQASFLTKKINFDGKRVQLNVWDTAGQERFHALGPIYYRSSNGAVLVYDITDQDSFEKVKNWVKELKKMLGNEVVLVIVGNKTDLEKDRNVQTQEAEEYATSVGARYFETSAKLNEGIEDVFLDLSAAMINNQNEKDLSDPRNSTLRSSNRLIVDDSDEPPPPPATKCCN